MKYESVIPDYKKMFESSVTLLALVASGWLLIKLIGACFWLPNALKKYEEEQREAEKLYLEEEEKKKRKEQGIEEEKSQSEASSDSEKEPCEQQKPTEEKSAENIEKGFIDNEDTGDDDATKKNK